MTAFQTRPAPLSADSGANATPAPRAIDAAEVARLFKEHNQLLVRFLRARLDSDQEAREVAQEAYVRLLELERTQTISFLRAYLFKIAANLAVDRLRQRSSRPHHEDIDLFEDVEADDAPERSVIAADQISRIAGFLEELPPKCSQSFVLHRFDGLTPSQVARALGLTDRMVRRHIVRAMVYCRMRLDGCSRLRAWMAARR